MILDSLLLPAFVNHRMFTLADLLVDAAVAASAVVNIVADVLRLQWTHFTENTAGSVEPAVCGTHWY